MTTDRSRRDGGFTLVEVVICVALLGILAPVVSSTIVVTLRSSPAVADRADAAVNVQGLVTWLPQDVDSATPGAFSKLDVPSGCGTGIDPTSSRNLLKLSWSETIKPTTKNYTASYRYVPKPIAAEGGQIVRVYCGDGATPQVFPVSGLIPAWIAGSEPVRVTLSDASGDSRTDTVKFEVKPMVGKTIVIVGTTKNPNETLATTTTMASPPTSTTTAPANQPPVANNLSYTITSGVPVSITVSGFDFEGGALTATFPAPSGWTVTPSGSPPTLTFTVTAPVGAASPTVAPYQIADPLGLTGSANVTFTVQPAASPNQAPVANASSGSTTPGAAVVVTLAASDPEAAPLTASVASVPVNWTAIISGLQVTITPPIDAVAGPSFLTYTVTDPGGLSASSTVTVTVTRPPPCVINTPVLDRTTVKLQTNNSPDGLKDPVTVTITIVGGYCEGLTLNYVTGGPGGLYTRNFLGSATSRSITLPQHPSPELWSTGTKTLQIKDSSNLVLKSVNLEVTL